MNTTSAVKCLESMREHVEIGYAKPYIINTEERRARQSTKRMLLVKQRLCGLFLACMPVLFGIMMHDYKAIPIISPVGLYILKSKNIVMMF